MKAKHAVAVAGVCTAGLVVAGIAAGPAMAAASDVGKNVGDEVRSWATALILGVAALVGLPILFRRDVSGGLVLALLVVVIGGFVFAPGTVRTVIRGLWQAIGG